jgi:hypothetical protein
MGYIITGLVSFTVAMLAFILQGVIKENKRLKTEEEQKTRKLQEEQAARMQALEDGVCCLLRKELIDDHEKWMARGHITPKALENGLAMYAAYKGLGGNGMIDHMKEEIEELHIQKG